jgi:hypothetical protein
MSPSTRLRLNEETSRTIHRAADQSVVPRDAFRVLQLGGRFAVSVVIADGPASDNPRQQRSPGSPALSARRLAMSIGAFVLQYIH